MSKKQDAAEWLANATNLIQPLFGKYCNVKFSRFSFDDLEIDKFYLSTQKDLGNRKPDKRLNSDGNGYYTPQVAVISFKSGEQLELVVEDTLAVAITNGVLFRFNVVDSGETEVLDLEIRGVRS